MEKKVVGEGNLQLHERKPALIELDNEYIFESLVLECEISGSPYLRTNSIQIRTESQKSSPIIREITLENQGNSHVVRVEFSKLPIHEKGVQVSKIYFTCNYNISMHVKILKEGTKAGSNLSFSFLTF
jgi:hypothetical protein